MMSKNKKLRIASCQFPVSADISQNSRYIQRLIRKAVANKADIVQFPETSLCGWGKWNNPSFKKFNFEALRRETAVIRKLAAEKEIWVILGSAHRLGSDFKPTNCLYVINHHGQIVDRYDKSWLVKGDESKTFTPGEHLVTFTLGGVRCGLMTCYDSNFLQMFNGYAHKKVELLLVSMGHAGFKNDYAKIDERGLPLLATYYRMWIAVSNSSSRYSGLITCLADPNGMGNLAKTLKRHRTGILYHDFTNSSFKDYWNNDVKFAKLHPKEIYHNGNPSRHPRALNRRSLP
jgi:predicted amidohydrolase